MDNTLRITSFNCNGVKHKLPIINGMCNDSSIVFLQETWLCPNELYLLDSVHNEFDCFSLSSVNIQDEVLIGRPYGGISILWKKSLTLSCNIIQYEDDRLLGLNVTLHGQQYLFLNVYLPYFCPDNENEYDMYMGKIASIIDNSDTSGVVVLGDFNASPNNSFYFELEQLCVSKDLIISDSLMLSPDTFTHVNNGTLSRSWVDHCVCSQSMHNAILNINVEGDYTGSDHFPMHVTFSLSNLPQGSGMGADKKARINWNFSNIDLSNVFYSILWQRLDFDPRHLVCACRGGCRDNNHKMYLESFWDHFVQTAQQVGSEVFGYVKLRRPCVPGWNDFVRDLYSTSREAFKAWKDSGSPRLGPVACLMRRSRADFKYALRQCRLQENELRAMALSEKLQNNEVVPFWREIQSLGGGGRATLPGRIDDAVGNEAIAEMWKNKFSHVLNSVNDNASRVEFLTKLAVLHNTPVPSVTFAEIQEIVKKLANNKAVGLDSIPNEFYKAAPPNILIMLSILFNSFLNHAFLPNAIMNVLIVPLLKGKLKDPTDSSNYRPIAIATAASKLFEAIIFERMEKFLHTSDHQFGFKPKHSTEMCVFALKEIIHYYRSLNTPVYLCFVDIKSAFDRVSYWKLLSKLVDRGVPLLIVQVLKYWFSTQALCVGWGSSLSGFFNMKNGIRQGSIISPHLFSVYVDSLNRDLSNSRIGCHVDETPMNNFSYADDLVIVTPSASALNDLLNICDRFAKDHYIIFSTTKSVCMRILPNRVTLNSCPTVYLGNERLNFVDSFNYLGHTITSDFKDDRDIRKEMRKICYRGNCLIRGFKFCNEEVKCALFKSYCYSLYCSSLWTNYIDPSLQRLKVNYNNIMRRLMGVPPFSSASLMFGSLGVKTLFELLRTSQYSLLKRVETSKNSLIIALNNSDIFLNSPIRLHWYNSLFVQDY